MNSKKRSGTNRLPSLYVQTLLKSEFDYRREMRRKLTQIQNDNRDAARRRNANNHVFVHAHLTKRHQWYNLDKAYRDTCRSSWNRQTAESGRTSHLFLPSIYPTENSTEVPLSILNRSNSIEDANPMIANERVKQNFLQIQPVMLEIIRAPHSSEVLKNKQTVELRKRSAFRRQAHIQKTAIDDDRYTQLIGSLEEA